MRTGESVQTGLWIAFLALGVVAFAVSAYRARKRREAFRAAGVRLGLSFERAATQLPEREFGALPLFTRGHSKRAYNVLRGSPAGIPVALFDYQYTVGSGKNRSTSSHTVAVFQLTKTLPWFTMAPEQLFHRIGELLGYRDIDFAHHPEFSQAYFLRGKDEQAVRTLFQPGIIAGLAQHRGWVLEGGGPSLLVYRASKRAPAERLRQFLDDTGRLAALFG